jgi:hypothetical protein
VDRKALARFEDYDGPVLVEFMDHALGMDPIKIKVCSFLYEIEEKHIKLVSWLPEMENKEDLEHNMEFCTVLIAAIDKIRKLRL